MLSKLDQEVGVDRRECVGQVWEHYWDQARKILMQNKSMTQIQPFSFEYQTLTSSILEPKAYHFDLVRTGTISFFSGSGSLRFHCVRYTLRKERVPVLSEQKTLADPRMRLVREETKKQAQQQEFFFLK